MAKEKGVQRHLAREDLGFVPALFGDLRAEVKVQSLCIIAYDVLLSFIRYSKLPPSL